MIVYEEDVVSLEELRSVLSTYAGPDEPRERPARAFRAVARRRFRRGRNADRRAGAVFIAVGAGVAAATGVLPGWKTEQAVMSSPFFTSADPATVAGSTVSLSVPGPESTTFEVVTRHGYDRAVGGRLLPGLRSRRTFDRQPRLLRRTWAGCRRTGTPTTAVGVAWTSVPDDP
jgi:hypothetical protein